MTYKADYSVNAKMNENKISAKRKIKNCKYCAESLLN